MSASPSPPSAAPAGRKRLGLRRGAIIALLLNVGSVGALYLAQVLLARWMGGPQEYGKYALAFTWSQSLGFVAGLGLPMAALRFVPQYLEHADLPRLRGLVRSSWILSFMVGAVLATIGTVVTVFTAPAAIRDPMLIGLWISPLLAIVNFQKEAARGARHMVLSLAPSQVLHPLLLIVAAMALYLATDSLNGTQAITLLGGTAVIVLAIQWIGLHRALPHDRNIAPVYELRTWLAVALPLFLVQESLVILRQTDVLMIGFFFEDTAEVGRYNAAARTAILARFALLAVNAIAAPMVATHHARGDMAALKRMVRTATRYMAIPSAVLTLGVCALASPLLGMFGDEFGQFDAMLALWILAGGQLAGALFGPVGHLLNLTGHHRKSMRVYGLTAGLNVALNLALIPLWGIEGAAVATSASLILRNVWSYALVRKHLNIHSFAFFGGHR